MHEAIGPAIPHKPDRCSDGRDRRPMWSLANPNRAITSQLIRPACTLRGGLERILLGVHLLNLIEIVT